MTVEDMLSENNRRKIAANDGYDPVAGDSSDPCRVCLDIRGLDPNPVWVPSSMRSDPAAAAFIRAGSIDAYVRNEMHVRTVTGKHRETARIRFAGIRMKHDFPFWAATCVKIKNKGGGPDVFLRLRRPQRRLVAALEAMRLKNQPIRLILLKARQWGGSTCVQLYMAWLQMIHDEGLNSLIVAHQAIATDEIKGMFDRMLESYPDAFFTDSDGKPVKGRRMVSAGIARGTYNVANRNFKIKLATAERPDACRGGDYSLVHCSEVGLWKATPRKSPDDIMRSATAGVLNKPMTMIVLESTANGTGTFFHHEYESAKRGESAYTPLFVAWHEIETYAMPLENPEEFARSILDKREEHTVFNDRAQPGAYIWMLWEKGATLEALNWYIHERRKYSDHDLMAAEFPSDDIEAFAHSGARVFDRYRTEAMRSTCRPAPFRGEMAADGLRGRKGVANVRFLPSPNGLLHIWKHPAPEEPGVVVKNRYLTVVDVGGRSRNADWSVIVVFDRLGEHPDGGPEVVAQWRGHTDSDLLAWNAARISRYYSDALLAIESNTLETHDPDRYVDGDQSAYILNQIRDVYPNLYARRQSEEDILRGIPRKYGFHTNIQTKPMVISVLVQAIREGAYTERDSDCIDEYLTYEQKPNGSYGAIPGRHDDLLMTRAIGLHISLNQMDAPRRAIKGVAPNRLPPSHAVF